MSTLKRLHDKAKSRRDGRPAFTLLELIVVLLVLGILAAIAVPTFNRVKENATVRVAQTTLEAIDRNGEAIARSDGNASDEAIAAAVESELPDQAGLTVTVGSGADADKITVTYVRGGITATGSVTFTDGVGTIVDAVVDGGAGGGSSSTTSTTAAPSFSLSYASTAFSLAATSETKSPNVSGGTASSYSYTGTLPTGVSFDTSTGVFTGPGSWGVSASALAVGDGHSCVRTSAGNVRCWGQSSQGALGDGAFSGSSTPVVVRTSATDSSPLSGVTQVSTNADTTCALLTSTQVRCWGVYAGLGNNGNGSSSGVPVAVHTSAADSSPLTGVTSVHVAQGGHVCAVLTSTQVRCWGSNWKGQLGDGTSTGNLSFYRMAPVVVLNADGSPLTGVTAVTGGQEFTCALLQSTQVRCWGRRDMLGDGSTDGGSISTSPVTVSTSASDATPLSGVVAIESGGYSTCALLSSGEARCWSSIPTVLETSATDSSPLTGISSFSGGDLHTCAVLTTGQARCWGSNGSGQLGDGTTTTRNSPVVVLNAGGSPLTGVTAIGAGSWNYHTCALMNDGGVKCWGGNSNNVLGTGTPNQNSGSPVSVAGLGNPGWPASITVTVTSSTGTTTNTNVTLTNS